MKEFDKTKTNINLDIDRVFHNIYTEFKENYSSPMEKNISDDDLDNLRVNIKNYIPKTVNYKKILILDTLLNYLTDDARQILEGYDNKTINAFYDQNRNWIKIIRNRYQYTTAKSSLSLSPDVSMIYSILSGVLTFSIGVLVENLFLKWGLILLMIIIFVALRVAEFTYKMTIPKAKQNIHEDVKRYLEQSQAQTKQELAQIIKIYIKNFEHFMNSPKQQFIQNKIKID